MEGWGVINGGQFHRDHGWGQLKRRRGIAHKITQKKKKKKAKLLRGERQMGRKNQKEKCRKKRTSRKPCTSSATCVSIHSKWVTRKKNWKKAKKKAKKKSY